MGHPCSRPLRGFVSLYIQKREFGARGLIYEIAFAYQGWRPAAGLPIAIAITTLMPLCGLGVDVMTLMALILVMGMLVGRQNRLDEAIVVEFVPAASGAPLPPDQVGVLELFHRGVRKATGRFAAAIDRAAGSGGSDENRLEPTTELALPDTVLCTAVASDRS